MGGDPEGIDLAAPVAAMLRARLAGRGDEPFLIGIAGSVAVGKSTFASALVDALGETVEVLGTDGFLYPNAELTARGLGDRKGFPESYDHTRIEALLTSMRAGRSARVPVYSHETYDIVAGATREVRPRRRFILEGVNALQFAPLLDYSIYIDAPLAAIEEWYVTRLREVVADPPPNSFYSLWEPLAPDELDATARGIWRGINLANLEQCIAPTRAAADVVVVKGSDHRLAGMEVRP